jgi:hypothetical protein
VAPSRPAWRPSTCQPFESRQLDWCDSFIVAPDRLARLKRTRFGKTFRWVHFLNNDYKKAKIEKKSSFICVVLPRPAPLTPFVARSCGDALTATPHRLPSSPPNPNLDYEAPPSPSALIRRPVRRLAPPSRPRTAPGSTTVSPPSPPS